jgi:predicted homoserine dehydrogenase-like protein
MMVTSFADGTKISYEQALVANATGMQVAKRGMLGYDYTNQNMHTDDLTKVYDIDMLRAHGGIVEYVVGVKPAPGVYVLAAREDPKQKHFLNYYKLGEGPLYSFYTPYHLCHFEVPFSLARAALFNDAVLQPLGAPMVEVITLAKTDLQAGDEIDGLGGYKAYGQCENSPIVASENLLPIGLAEGCTLKHAVPKDQALTFDDVHVPEGRLIDKLYAEQRAHFST